MAVMKTTTIINIQINKRYLYKNIFLKYLMIMKMMRMIIFIIVNNQNNSNNVQYNNKKIKIFLKNKNWNNINRMNN
jgi:hypothetical protein